LWSHADKIGPERGIVRLRSVVMGPDRDGGDGRKSDDDDQADALANDL
jgi:hypothetical protein